MIWSLLWLVVFAAALAGFVLVSLAIAIKGVAEIRDMLRGLNAHADVGSPEEHER
jgi:hypothetical protein